MSAKDKKIVLIDGHSNIHKSYHAIRQSLTNSLGEPTSAVFGFLNTFMRLYRELEFDYVAVVFDAPGPTFRKELFEEYKANRPPMPEDLKVQEQRVLELLKILAVPTIQMEGFEADDVIAGLALRAVQEGGEAVVCSSDKDLLQVVKSGIIVFREHLQKAEWLDEQGVIDKMGVKPEQVPAYLGLVGDTSDNIPGVPGIGKKGAVKLLQEYGSLEDIIAAVPEMKKSKTQRALEEHAEEARLSTRLATLRPDCVEDFDWKQYRWSFQPSDELREFYRLMEFNSYLEELGGQTVEQREISYSTVRTREDLTAAAKEIRRAGKASVDTETTDLDPFTASLVGISVSWGKNQAAYIPVRNDDPNEVSIDFDDLRETFAPLLSDPKVQWTAHHWNFDYKILKMSSLEPGAIHGDTMIAAYLMNPDRPGSLRLKDLAVQRLGITMTEITELVDDSSDMLAMASVPLEEIARYACQDADVTLQLHETLEKGVREAGMEELYQTIELPLIPILADMELEGVRIDREYFRNLSQESEKELERLTKEIYQIAGRQFKINSPKQVAQILFEELELPAQRKGKSGTYSTDVNVLEGLKNLHPLPAKLLEYRGVEKLKNTYIDPLPGLVNPITGRLHTSFNQTVAATGRLSSSNPNLQNIPIRTEAGRQIRRGFIPREDGWRLVSADYSQIELRIMAHLSQDKALCEAFQAGADVHTETAAKVFGIPREDVTSTQRSQAKAINFGIMYGMTEYRLARDLDISRGTAKQFIEEYFRVYEGVYRFLEETKEKAREERFVTTICGRRRFVPDINSRNFNQRSLAERIAVNTPIQGASADMIKLAMLRVADRLKKEEFRGKMVLQVHDELIFDCPEEEVEKLSAAVREEMTRALPLDVPIQVDISTADNWADC